MAESSQNTHFLAGSRMAWGVGAARRPVPGRGATATLLAAATGATRSPSTEEQPGSEAGETEQKENQTGAKDRHGYMPKSS